MIFISSKVGLLLVVFKLQLANGELEKDSTEEKPASEKAKLRDWFFRLSLRNDLINLKKEGEDYLPVVKLRSEDGEGEDFSILLDKDHPHPDNKCSSQSASQDKEMRFVMRGLDQEFMCTEIKKKIQDVPEERSMSGTGGKRGFSRGHSMDEKAPEEQSEMVVEVEPVVGEEIEEAEVFAKVIEGKNGTKSVGALDPLIDHLNGVASHERFQDPFYVKAIQDLVEDFRKHNLSEATWDQDKLNTILDKIEELVTGNIHDNSQIEVINASDDLQLLSEDVEKIEQELDALPLIVNKATPTNRPDISAVSQSLDQLMINLQNFADTESPEGRMAGSQNDGRVSGDKMSSEGADKKAAAIEQVIDDLRKFVDLTKNTGMQRSGPGDSDDFPDGRNAVNATSGESSGNATTTDELEQVGDGESPGNTTNTEDLEQVNDGESPGSDTTTEELEQVHEQTTLLSNDSLIAEESSTKDSETERGAQTSETDASVPSGSVTTGNPLLNGSTTGDSSNGGTTGDISTTKNNLNDTDENEESIYGPEGLIGMLTSWKQKFFIILGCFIVSMLLFLIIIAVLIYKIQQNKPNRDATK